MTDHNPVGLDPCRSPCLADLDTTQELAALTGDLREADGTISGARPRDIAAVIYGLEAQARRHDRAGRAAGGGHATATSYRAASGYRCMAVVLALALAGLDSHAARPSDRAGAHDELWIEFRRSGYAVTIPTYTKSSGHFLVSTLARRARDRRSLGAVTAAPEASAVELAAAIIRTLRTVHASRARPAADDPLPASPEQPEAGERHPAARLAELETGPGATSSARSGAEPDIDGAYDPTGGMAGDHGTGR